MIYMRTNLWKRGQGLQPYELVVYTSFFKVLVGLKHWRVVEPPPR